MVAKISLERFSAGEATPTSAVTDPAVLAAANLLMFKKFIFASGELEMPCEPDLLDQHMALITDVLQALSQYPPPEVLQSWRELVASKLVEGAAASAPMRLVFRYKPFSEFAGLTSGFQIGISLREATAAARTSVPLPETESYDARDRLEQQTLAQGKLEMPCVPSMTDQLMGQVETLLRALVQDITPEVFEQGRQAIATKVNEWFQASSNTYLVVTYMFTNPERGLHGGIQIDLTRVMRSIEEMYRSWTETRKGALFGSHADAKVLATVAQLGAPETARILDVGAGTGRNSLPLAKLGYAVDAVELTEVLGSRLLEAAQAEGVAVNLMQGNVLDPQLPLQTAHYQLVFLSEVIASHMRSQAEVRQIFVRLLEAIAPGGFLLFNLFLTVDGYEPDITARELSQFYWTYIMTRAELNAAIASLPLEILSDESAMEYEQQHLPATAWPPTSWFVEWATGRNLFPLQKTPPVELRWVLCRKLS